MISEDVLRVIFEMALLSNLQIVSTFSRVCKQYFDKMKIY